MYCECEVCQAQRREEENRREEEEALLDEDDFDEDERFEREQERLAQCTCGAYILGKNGYYQVADCICGM